MSASLGVARRALEANRKPNDALSTIKAMLADGLDCNVQIWADSIGNEAGDGSTTLREWPYLLADRFAAAYPTYKVQVMRWGLSSGTTYEATPIAISAGQGGSPPVLTFYNFAVASAPLAYGMGSSWQTALVAPAADALIIGMGNNHVYGSGTTLVPGNDPAIRGELIAAIEQYKLFKPAVPIDLILANPRRDDDLMSAVYADWKRVAQYRDIGLVDVYAAFMALGRPATLYQSTGDTTNDNVHPGQLGSNLYRDVIWAVYAAAEARFPSPRPSLFVPGPADVNLLANGDFSQWDTSPGAPNNWTTGGAGTLTVTKDTTVFPDNRRAYSAKLQGATDQSYLQQLIAAPVRTLLQGQRVTLAVKRYMPDTSGSDVGRIELSMGSPALGTQVVSSRPFVTRANGWMWVVLSGAPVPADCNSFAVRLYHDRKTGTPSSFPVYYDQAILTTGYMPAGLR